MNKKSAIKNIHVPEDILLLKKARQRIKYEELFMYVLKINYLTNKINNDNLAIERNIDKDKLDFIHLNKTAAMIVGCMRAGAIIGDASEEELEKITKYSENIGLSFQIVDDILDIVGDEEKLGKPIGSDIENHKSTYPSLLGLEKSRCIARQLIEEGKSSIKDLPSEKDFLNQLGDYIISRDC